MSDSSIVLLPGMGADDRLFKHQMQRFGNLVVPKWIPARKRESLSDYAKRMAEELPSDTVMIGGCSLGGMVVVEIARHMNVKACLLISSASRAAELPRRIRIWRPVRVLIAGSMFTAVPFSRMALWFSRWMKPSTRSFWNQLASTEGRFFRWAVGAVLSWRDRSPSNVPVFRIHGDRDRVLPIRGFEPDEVVRGGGHLLPLTHAAQVNAFIEQVIESLNKPLETRSEVG